MSRLFMEKNPTNQEIIVIDENPKYLRRHAIEETVQARDAFFDLIAKNRADAEKCGIESISLRIINSRQTFFDDALLCFYRGQAIRILDQNGDFTEECRNIFAELPSGTIISAILLKPGESEELFVIKITKEKTRTKWTLQKLKLEEIENLQEIDNPRSGVFDAKSIKTPQFIEQISEAGNVVFILRPDQMPIESDLTIKYLIFQYRRGVKAAIARIIDALREFLH